ncbi:MAG: EI24 domain-containing protein [Ginsengibacter sp.]
MLEEIITAIQSYYRAHQFIVKNKLWKWIWIPGIIYAVLFVVGLYFFWHSAASVSDFLLNGSGVKEWLKRENSPWLNFIIIFGQLSLQLILLLFYFSWFKYLYLIIGSPLFAYLSEKTESIILEMEYPFSLKKLFQDSWRGIQIAIRNSLWQTVYTISIILLTFIPLVGWITPLLALFVECYFLGFSMLDYTNERKNLSPTQSIFFINRHKGLAIGNGLVFYLIHWIPIIGWVLAPGYAIIAATLSLQNRPKK